MSRPTLRRNVLVMVGVAVSMLGLSVFTPANATIEITLKNSFIEQYKDRATIAAQFTIDMAHKKPNPPSKDGDLHIAGRAPEIKLATVAEIMNAKSQSAAVDLVHQNEGSGKPINVVGAWRLWCEHGGDSFQTQGSALQPFTTTNPDHVFEIHPLTQVGSEDVSASFEPIDGFQYKDADTAFHTYEGIRSAITCKETTTSITTGMAGYNYVAFTLELNEDATAHPIPDGLTVKASVLDDNGDLLVRERRMVFIKGTAPYDAVKNGKKGDSFHVLGVPRIDLSLVSWRCRAAAGKVPNLSAKPGVLRWNLPYEMVVVAILN
jgi:hypothetical protein